MTFLNEIINSIEDVTLREELQERIDLVEHKIKFMDKVPVACLDIKNKPVFLVWRWIEAIGGVLEEDPMQAKVLIYMDQETGMWGLMGNVPDLLQPEWPAVAYNRVYVMDDPIAYYGNAEAVVSGLEDLAEMLYPGYFVFGNEGKTWTSFAV